jgi:hypothetical protein
VLATSQSLASDSCVHLDLLSQLLCQALDKAGIFTFHHDTHYRLCP